jgi:hypothetical protein
VSALPSVTDGQGGEGARDDEGKDTNGSGHGRGRGIPGEICVLMEFSSCGSSRSRGTDTSSPDSHLVTRYVHSRTHYRNQDILKNY